MRFNNIHITKSQVVSPSPVMLSYVVLTSDGGGVADITIYDGESSNDDKLVTLKAASDGTSRLRFGYDLVTRKGLYIEIGSNVEGVLVIYSTNQE